MQPEKSSIRIIAGTLRGRRLTVVVNDELRPTPQRVRESFFSILGNAIPGRPFIDVFAGTGVVGIEAISRGATLATFLEKDPKSAADILKYLREFEVFDKGLVLRTDVYRWAERWIPPLDRPVNLFLSPPFKDFDDRMPEFIKLVELLWDKLPDESVMTIQGENEFPIDRIPEIEAYDYRKYGRNLLLIRVKGEANGTQGQSDGGDPEGIDADDTQSRD